MNRLWAIGLSMFAAVLLAALLAGCGSSKPAPKARQPDRVIVRDVPAVIRDTIGAQATLQGTDSVLVSGYGLVVGLNNTGGGDVPSPVRAIMEREMLLMGVGKEIGPFRGLSPNDIMNDKRTAVVLVSAVVPPGAPRATRFDVRVDVLPGTSTSSLEGGRLYTTRLFRGLVRPASPATEAVAEARGELFLNPFADPAKSGQDSALRTAGRVLNGGIVIQPLKITLALDASSHTRVRAIADAINGRFPRGRGDPPTAVGRNEEIVELSIPGTFRENPDEFLNLVRRVRVDRSFPEEAAVRYARALKEQPELASELAWCLEALGPAAIPALRELYDYPEVLPRQTAITAGAKLGDMLTRPHLEELALSGPPGTRTAALRLMGSLGTDPKIDSFLRDQLGSTELDMRIAAYEALEKRRDPIIERRRVGDKFLMDLVPSPEPMVYVTMQKAPRVVIFGDELAVRRPVFVSVWDDRLMLSADSERDPLRVYYRDYRSGEAIASDIKPRMDELVEYMAHETTPEEPAPGLDLNYSEVVGALATMLRKGASPAVFVPETDKLELELLRARQTESGADRPELAGGEEPDLETPPDVEPADRPEGSPLAGQEPALFDDAATNAADAPDPAAEPAAPAKKRYVVDLVPPGGTTTQQSGSSGSKKKNRRPGYN